VQGKRRKRKRKEGGERKSRNNRDKNFTLPQNHHTTCKKGHTKNKKQRGKILLGQNKPNPF